MLVKREPWRVTQQSSASASVVSSSATIGADRVALIAHGMPVVGTPQHVVNVRAGKRKPCRVSNSNALQKSALPG